MSDLKVNAREWGALAPEQQTKITAIMREQGFLTGTSRIVGDEAAPSSSEVVAAATTHLAASARAQKGITSAAALTAGFSFCKIGCDIAEAAAVAACALVPQPGNIICIAAAHAGGEYCRSQCD